MKEKHIITYKDKSDDVENPDSSSRTSFCTNKTNK